MADAAVREADVALAAAVLSTLDQLPIGVTVTCFGGDRPQRIYANQALASIVGVARDDLARSQPLAHLRPDERPRLEALQRAWIDGSAAPAQLETELVAADGRLIPVEVRAAVGAIGGDPMVVLFVVDISDRRRVEEALRASEALFRQVAEGAPDAITIVVAGRFAYANPATARLLGYADPAEIQGLPLSSFLEGDELAAMGDRIRRMFAGETIPPREYRGRRRDGGHSLVEISSMPIAFRGRPAALAIGREVGERRRRQAEMVRAERMAAVGTLAAGVAHEINNPLTYVMLQLDRLRSGLQRAVDDPRQRSQLLAMVADASDGSQRVAGIVRDLLWFSRGDADIPVPVDAAEVVETAVKLATSAVRHRAQVVRHVAPAPLAAVSGPRLAQVLVNLLVNAAQAFERDDLAGNRIEVSVTGSGGNVVIEVADNGPGFVEHLLAHVFEPFFTTKPGGTGLGLAISRSIIEEAGGTITALGRSGGGGLVQVVVPAWRGTAVVAPAPVVASALLPRSRVAIIDDEASIARSLGDWLEIDHEVAIYTGAEQALIELESRAPYDVVICDLRMPVLSGLELLRRLLATRPEYRGRFVFIGGAVSPDQVVAAGELAAEVLHKPFDMNAIDQAVARRLREWRPAAS